MKKTNSKNSLAAERLQKARLVVTFPVVEEFTLKSGVRVKPGMRVWWRV